MTTASIESANEARLQHELGLRVYAEAERLRNLALARIGINGSFSMPGVDCDAVFSHPDARMWRINIGDRWQISSKSENTRLVEVSKPKAGLEIGRFFQPDGSMWVQADSSQGEPWCESRLPTETLLKVLDCLEIPPEANCDIEVRFTAFKPSDFPEVVV